MRLRPADAMMQTQASQNSQATISFPWHADSEAQNISNLVFSDAGRTAKNVQLRYIAGLLVYSMQIGSTFHTLFWSSHRYCRPVQSIGAAAMIASG